jgi:hypothetical protein
LSVVGLSGLEVTFSPSEPTIDNRQPATAHGFLKL